MENALAETVVSEVRNEKRGEEKDARRGRPRPWLAGSQVKEAELS